MGCWPKYRKSASGPWPNTTVIGLSVMPRHPALIRAIRAVPLIPAVDPENRLTVADPPDVGAPVGPGGVGVGAVADGSPAGWRGAEEAGGGAFPRNVSGDPSTTVPATARIA